MSCLLETKEWHEGVILSYHPKSGKHHVDFRSIGERKWTQMSKVAFYVIERPQFLDSAEVKEMDHGYHDGPTNRDVIHFPYFLCI